MNDRLRADLEYGADTIPIPPGDLDRVKIRARRREQRHRRFAGATAAVALVAGTLGVFQLGDDAGDETPVAAEGGTAAELGDAGIVWERVADPASALGGFQSQAPVTAGDRLYAISTAPGERSNDVATPRVLWSSTDGVEWDRATAPADLYLMDLASDGEQLYAVGTGQAVTATTARGQKLHEVVVGTSADGGNWERSTLPLDIETITAQSTGVYMGATEVAAGPGGIVAALSLHAELDVPALLPDGAGAPSGWTIDEQGVTVLGAGPTCPAGTSPVHPEDAAGGARAGQPEQASRVYGVSCWDADGNGQDLDPTEAYEVAGHYSWAELGVHDLTRRAALGEPFFFHGTDGRFEPVTLPGSLAGSSGVLEARPDGSFLYAASVPRQVGRSGPPPDLQLLQSADGRTWERTTTGIGDLWGVLALGTVDGHLAVVGHTDTGASYAQLGDAGWQVTPIAELLGIPVSEDRGAWVTAASVGPLGAVLGVGTSHPDGNASHSIVASRDGETWEVQPLEALAGERVRGISQIAVTGDRAAVSVAVGPPDGMGLSQIVAIVGTPR